jgi:hypothetical protein
MAEIDLRQARRTELENQGVYCRTEDARRAWTRELIDFVNALDQWLLTAAERLERDHGIDHKAATVLLRGMFREFRQTRSDLARSATQAMPADADED